MADKKPKDDKAIIEEALKRFNACEDRESDNWDRAKSAIRFRSLEQWPEQIKQDRLNPQQEGGPQPCPVLDKTNQYVRQVVNEERMNRPSIKVRPVDDEADIEVAKVYDGIIRHIQDSSNADIAYSTAGEHAAEGGFGYWRLQTDYCDPMSMDQDILIKRIPNRFMVLLGPHQELDGSDAKYGFVFEDIPKDEFESSYPGIDPGSAESLGLDAPDWSSDDMVRVCEYFKITNRKTEIVETADGQVIEKSNYQENSSHVIQTRSTVIKQLKWYKLTGGKVLETRDLPGSFIPIVKVIGNEIVTPEGKFRLSGMVESMMDPQRLHNYAHAGFITQVALAPRAPWVAAEGQLDGHENTWKQANRRNIAVLQYKAISDDTGQPIPRPERTTPAGVPPGWQQILLDTEHGIESAVGMYGPSIGGPSRERSGVALEGQQQQGSVGNYHYPDNLARSIRHTGRILLEWIPVYYDRQRIARMLGEDGTPEMAHLDPDQQTAVAPKLDNMGQKIGTSYNLNVGTYDVTISVGPSWTTKRQEGAQLMNDAIKANPQLTPLIGDLYFRALDVPYADKIAERLKAMLPPQIQQMEASQKEGPIDPRVQALMQQIDQQSQQLQARGQALVQAEQQLQQQSMQVGADKQSLKAQQDQLEASRKVFAADVAKAEAELELQGMKIMDEVRQVQSQPLPETESNEPIQAQPPQPPVQVIDSAVSQPLEQVGQAVAQTNQILVELAQSIAANSQQLSALIAQQSQPKVATLPDGRRITLQNGTIQ